MVRIGGSTPEGAHIKVWRFAMIIKPLCLVPIFLNFHVLDLSYFKI